MTLGDARKSKFEPKVDARLNRGRLFRWICLGAIWFGVLSLVILLVDIVTDGFGVLSLDFIRNYPSRLPSRAGLPGHG